MVRLPTMSPELCEGQADGPQSRALCTTRQSVATSMQHAKAGEEQANTCALTSLEGATIQISADSNLVHPTRRKKYAAEADMAIDPDRRP